MKRWIARLNSYEPPHKSKQWGATVVEFVFTGRLLRPKDEEIELSPRKYFVDRAVDDAEQRGKTLMLFPHDISYREVYQAIAEEYPEYL